MGHQTPLRKYFKKGKFEPLLNDYFIWGKSKQLVVIVGGILRTSWDFSKPRDVHFGNLTICCFIFHMVSIVQCGRLFQIFSIFFHKYVFFKKNIF